MKKPLRRYTIAAVRIFFIVIILSTFAVAEAQQERSRNPFQRLQQQIDTLNKCRQPVLVRFQVELVLSSETDESPESRLHKYITGLRDPIEALYPSDSLRRALSGAADAGLAIQNFLANADSFEKYWKQMDVFLQDSQDELYELRLALFLLRLTDYHQPLFERLRQLQHAEGLITLRDISNVTAQRWRELLAESGADLDPELFVRNVAKTFDAILYGGCN
jgi:hypothetical protein